jgi:hypothetical protein
MGEESVQDIFLHGGTPRFGNETIILHFRLFGKGLGKFDEKVAFFFFFGKFRVTNGGVCGIIKEA